MGQSAHQRAKSAAATIGLSFARVCASMLVTAAASATHDPLGSRMGMAQQNCAWMADVDLKNIFAGRAKVLTLSHIIPPHHIQTSPFGICWETMKFHRGTTFRYKLVVGMARCSSQLQYSGSRFRVCSCDKTLVTNTM